MALQVAKRVLAHEIWAASTLQPLIQRLPDEIYHGDAGLVFRSAHGLLNHMCVASDLWLHRFLGKDHSHLSQWWSVPYAKKGDTTCAWETVHKTRHEAFAKHQEIFTGWATALAGFNEEQFQTPLTYRDTSGATKSIARPDVCIHVVTHNIHHRGQITAWLHQSGFEVPSLDLPLSRAATLPTPTAK
eukprot:m.49316 g.49316  ORF g.49316 m.49316 type:complete len:187 (-) comp11474_c1_seq1:433-993(-)